VRYPYKVNDNFLDYEFTSIGPKGYIKKVARFTRITGNVFNLAFGDLQEESDEIDDMTVTNGGDSYKVLTTVASIVYDFAIKNTDTWIIAKGSTSSRTRLYRMGINNHWEEINNDFEILGFKNDS
jgi:hypothetical protein